MFFAEDALRAVLSSLTKREECVLLNKPLLIRFSISQIERLCKHHLEGSCSGCCNLYHLPITEELINVLGAFTGP